VYEETICFQSGRHKLPWHQPQSLHRHMSITLFKTIFAVLEMAVNYLPCDFILRIIPTSSSKQVN
jgi:hypothetical protein